MTVKIAWGLVSYGAIFLPKVYASHMAAMGHAQKVLMASGQGSIATIGATDRMYTHTAENVTAREFLAGDYTHLFMTEQDMILPTDTIPKLLALDQPVAAGLYMMREGDGAPCLFQKTVTPATNPYPHSPVTMFPADRPFRNDCPGLGCALIRREVFERVPFPWFDLKESNYGSDMYFFTKVRDAGLEVWVDPSVRCGHMDYKEWSFEDWERRVKTDPSYPASGFLIGAARR